MADFLPSPAIDGGLDARPPWWDHKRAELFPGEADGRGHPQTEVDHVPRAAPDPPPDRRRATHGAVLSGAEPQRTRAHRLRAPEPACPERRQPRPHRPTPARTTGGTRHSRAAGQGRVEAARGAEGAGMDRPLRAGRRDRRRPGGAGAPGVARGDGAARGRAMERTDRPAPLPGLPPPGRSASALRHRRSPRALAGLPAVLLRGPVAAVPRRLHRLGRGGPAQAPGPGGRQPPLPDPAVGARRQPGVQGPVAGDAPAGGRLEGAPRLPPGAGGDLRRPGPVRRRLVRRRRHDARLSLRRPRRFTPCPRARNSEARARNLGTAPPLLRIRDPRGRRRSRASSR